MNHRTGSPTKSEQARFDKMKALGTCMACYIDGEKSEQYIEIHHLKSGGRRIGHDATISLCPWHHRAAWHNLGMTLSAMLSEYGPSTHRHQRLFQQRYGSDAELLEMQNRMLENSGP